MDFELKSVLISDEVDQRCIDILQSNGIEAVKNTKLTKDQLKAEISKYDGLIVRSATKVTADVIAAGSRLKIVGRAGTGIDNVDAEAATKRGIIVMNTPGGNTLSAAEHTCALIMAMSRHVSRGSACLRDGRWDDKKHLVGVELSGKTLALVGLGRIGREVASRMQAFGMTTIGYDPVLTVEDGAKIGVKLYASTDELWPLADYITLHTPLLAHTRHLIGTESLAKCKRGVRIVNCARGGIVDETALLAALESGQCAGAALDVFEQEPPLATNPLLKHPLVTCTPHLGASTVEAQSRVAVDIAEQFVAFTRQTAIVGAVNAPAVSLAMNRDTKPWLKLASTLGKISRILIGRPIDGTSTITITTGGDILTKSIDALSAAALVELLPRLEDTDSFNLVSAPVFAKNLGIQVVTVQDTLFLTTGEKSSTILETISLSLSTSKSPSAGSGKDTTVTVVGVLVAGQPHWFSVDGAAFWQPIRLEGNLIVCHCTGTCSPSALTVAINGAIDKSGAKDTVILSLQSASPSTSHGGATWCVATTSAPVEQLVPLSPSTVLTQISL